MKTLWHVNDIELACPVGSVECLMRRFVEGEPRTQSLLFPERLDDWIGEDNPVRVIETFVEERDLKELGFEGGAITESGG